MGGLRAAMRNDDGRRADISARASQEWEKYDPNLDSRSQAISGQAIRRIIVEQSARAAVGHIGSALSVADMIAALYGAILHVPEPDHADRDRLVLSKGHASLALYAALFLRGWLTHAQLDSYCQDDSLLGVHPDHALPGVDFSTGSLGQGLSFAAGAALAARLQSSRRRVAVLLSDAECNEGSVWEAVMFAAHHRLSNLLVLIDVNGQQALGYTRDILSPSPLAQQWRSFGWDVDIVDGHDSDALVRLACGRDRSDPVPHAILAQTISGKGVSFMEGRIEWHYLPMSDEQYHQALSEIGHSR